jgi:hypothetical protein
MPYGTVTDALTWEGSSPSHRYYLFFVTIFSGAMFALIAEQGGEWLVLVAILHQKICQITGSPGHDEVEIDWAGRDVCDHTRDAGHLSQSDR